jgi:hypothetical protein
MVHQDIQLQTTSLPPPSLAGSSAGYNPKGERDESTKLFHGIYRDDCGANYDKTFRLRRASGSAF